MVSIRSGTSDDEAELFELVRTFPTPTSCSRERYALSLKTRLSDPDSCLLVAEDAGRLVGYLAGYRHATFYAGGPTSWVDEVLVIEDSRGRGIGRRLMQAFEEWSKEGGCVLVALATRGAVPFYERLGFTSTAGYFKKYLSAILLGLLLCVDGRAQEVASLASDPPVICAACEVWNARVEPYRIFGNTYYVGVAGLSAILITSDEGHILADGGLPQSAALIDESIRSLGFRSEDIRLIVASHEHFDHAGGIAAIQRLSGAPVLASRTAARALEQGEPTPEDPQFALGNDERRFPRVARVRAVADGEVVRVGPLAVTAHVTPGHTPGSTSWTWRSCHADRCLDLVYADSLNPVSAPGFRFSDVPARVQAFRGSIDKVRTLPCDILLSVHPEFANLDGKRRLRTAGSTPDPFIDASACRAYAERAGQSLDRRLRDEN